MWVSGLRVLRGPDWRGGDTDGGEGHVGTVLELLGNHRVRVLWDMGQESTCSAGHDGKCELRVFDSAQIGVCHRGTTCAECGDTDVCGMLWRCQVCAGCDLCPLCYHDDRHDLRHHFLRIDAPEMDGEPVAKRKTSIKHRSLGIFPGAKVTRGVDWQWDDQDGGEGSEGEVKGYENVSPDSSRNLVQVTWPNGFVNSYRLGFHGYVDLTCVEEEVGPSYYRDHLPVLDTTVFFLPEQLVSGSVSTAQQSCTSENDASAEQTKGSDSVSTPLQADDTIAAQSPDETCNGGKRGSSQASLSKTDSEGDSEVVVVGQTDNLDSIGQTAEGTQPETTAVSKVKPDGRVSERETTHVTESAISDGGEKGATAADEARETILVGSDGQTFVAGEKVSVKVSENKLLEIMGDMEGVTEVIGQTGEVVAATGDGALSVSFESGMYKLHPDTLAKVPTLTAGSTVRILDSEEEVKILNTRVGWKNEMSATLGKAGRVSNVDNDGDVLVSFGRHHYLFAPACCVPAPDTKPDSLRIDSGGKLPESTPCEPSKDSDGNSALATSDAASKRKNEEVFRMLRERIKSEERVPTLLGQGDIRVLLAAVKKCHHQLVRDMCMADPTLLEQEHQNITPLMMACAVGKKNIQVVKTLLEFGANVNHGLPPFRTPLHACMEGESVEILEMLLKAGADLYTVDHKRHTYLHFAAAYGLAPFIRAFAAAGLDVNIKDDYEDTPLHVAIEHFKEAGVAALVDLESTDLHARNKEGLPPLHLASKKGFARAVELLLARDKSQINELCQGKFTPLHLAATKDQDECIRVLVLVGGADVNFQRIPGGSSAPLHTASILAKFKAAEALLELGANVHARDGDADTPLHLALGGPRRNDPEKAKLECEVRIGIACMLISNGAYVDAENRQGRIPLSYGIPPVRDGVRRFMERNPELVKRKGGGRSEGANIFPSPSLPHSLPSTLQAAHEGGNLNEALKGMELPCGLCGAPKSDVTLLPCQHKCVCKACSVKVIQCPLCDEEVKDKEVTEPGRDA